MWIFLIVQYLLISQKNSNANLSLNVSGTLTDDDYVIVDDDSKGRQISVVSMIHIVDRASDIVNPIVSTSMDNKSEHARANNYSSSGSLAEVELSCKGSCRAVGAWLRQTILISTLFYISISFDMSGIDKGWSTSIWICSVVVCMSVLLLLYVDYARSKFTNLSNAVA
jgi:hypothetical protein